MAKNILVRWIVNATTKDAKAGIEDLDKTSKKSFKKTEQYGKEASKSVGDSFSDMFGAIFAAAGISKIISIFSTVIDKSRDIRTAFLGLKASTDSMGQSFETAKQTVRELSADGVVMIGDLSRSMQMMNSLKIEEGLGKQLLQATKQISAIERVTGDASQAMFAFWKGVAGGELELIENISPRIKVFIKQIGDSSKITQDAATRQKFFNEILRMGAENLEAYNGWLKDGMGASSKLKSELDLLAESTGNLLDKAIGPLTFLMAETVSVFRRWFDSLTDISKILVIVIPLIGLLSTALGAVASILGAGKLTSVLLGGLAALVNPITLVVVGLGALIAVIAEVSAARERERETALLQKKGMTDLIVEAKTLIGVRNKSVEQILRLKQLNDILTESAKKLGMAERFISAAIEEKIKMMDQSRQAAIAEKKAEMESALEKYRSAQVSLRVSSLGPKGSVARTLFGLPESARKDKELEREYQAGRAMGLKNEIAELESDSRKLDAALNKLGGTGSSSFVKQQKAALKFSNFLDSELRKSLGDLNKQYQDFLDATKSGGQQERELKIELRINTERSNRELAIFREKQLRAALDYSIKNIDLDKNTQNILTIRFLNNQKIQLAEKRKQLKEETEASINEFKNQQDQLNNIAAKEYNRRVKNEFDVRERAIKDYYSSQLEKSVTSIEVEKQKQIDASKDLYEEKLRQAGKNNKEIELLTKEHQERLTGITKESIKKTEEARLEAVSESLGQVNQLLEGVKAIKFSADFGETISGIGKITESIGGLTGYFSEKIGGVIGLIGTGISLTLDLISTGNEASETDEEREARIQKIIDARKRELETLERITSEIIKNLELENLLLDISKDKDRALKDTIELQLRLNAILAQTPEQKRALNLATQKGRQAELMQSTGVSETGQAGFQAAIAAQAKQVEEQANIKSALAIIDNIDFNATTENINIQIEKLKSLPAISNNRVQELLGQMIDALSATVSIRSVAEGITKSITGGGAGVASGEVVVTTPEFQAAVDIDVSTLKIAAENFQSETSNVLEDLTELMSVTETVMSLEEQVLVDMANLAKDMADKIKALSDETNREARLAKLQREGMTEPEALAAEKETLNEFIKSYQKTGNEIISALTGGQFTALSAENLNQIKETLDSPEDKEIFDNMLSALEKMEGYADRTEDINKRIAELSQQSLELQKQSIDIFKLAFDEAIRSAQEARARSGGYGLAEFTGIDPGKLSADLAQSLASSAEIIFENLFAQTKATEGARQIGGAIFGKMGLQQEKSLATFALSTANKLGQDTTAISARIAEIDTLISGHQATIDAQNAQTQAAINAFNSSLDIVSDVLQNSELGKIDTSAMAELFDLIEGAPSLQGQFNEGLQILSESIAASTQAIELETTARYELLAEQNRAIQNQIGLIRSQTEAATSELTDEALISQIQKDANDKIISLLTTQAQNIIDAARVPIIIDPSNIDTLSDLLPLSQDVFEAVKPIWDDIASINRSQLEVLNEQLDVMRVERKPFVDVTRGLANFLGGQIQLTQPEAIDAASRAMVATEAVSKTLEELMLQNLETISANTGLTATGINNLNAKLEAVVATLSNVGGYENMIGVVAGILDDLKSGGL